ncbi:matrilin-4-like [Mizuhopecten yessoensis]|uniref:matrilin-4-like n=1 Tax=Mizuhopecten yessoensis TaxID=6573 RepID=UPI000B45AD7C|nr:matrilin-4-like [Mizuhopecten yessoensis]
MGGCVKFRVSNWDEYRCTAEQPDEGQDCALSKVDLIIILDASGSVGKENYDKMLAFCKDFLRNAEIDSGNVRVGALIYSDRAEVQFNLNSYSTRTEVNQAIDEIPYISGGTNTADALMTMRNMFNPNDGDRDGVPNICIILTDGESSINSQRTVPEADKARDEEIHIYAIGIGLRDTKELDGIANKPASDNSFNVQTFEELNALSDQVFSSLCPGGTTTTYAAMGGCVKFRVSNWDEYRCTAEQPDEGQGPLP